MDTLNGKDNSKLDLDKPATTIYREINSFDTTISEAKFSPPVWNLRGEEDLVFGQWIEGMFDFDENGPGVTFIAKRFEEPVEYAIDGGHLVYLILSTDDLGILALYDRKWLIDPIDCEISDFAKDLVDEIIAFYN